MNSDVLVQKFILFGLVIVGYLINKRNILDAHTNEHLSSFLLRVTLPCTILASAFSNSDVDNGLILHVTLVALIAFIITPILSFFIAKIAGWDQTYQLMLNYSNLGFMGLPIIRSVYGEEAIIYVAIFMMVFNIHVFSVGIVTLQGKLENPSLLLKKMCNPGIISSLCAYVIVLTGLKAPTFVSGLLSSVGSVTTPLAMIVIGSQLAEVNILKSLRNPRLYLMSVIKLFIYPIALYFLFRAVLGDSIIVQITAILMGLPVAGNVTMLCSEYGGNTGLAAEGTCITTILSLVSIPVILAIF